MPVSVTESAAEQIKKQLAKRGKGIGLKLAVKKAGCSGFTYVLDYADTVSDGDTIFENYGVKLIVPNDDLAMVDGVELDFRREGLNDAFKFNNPNAKGTCGCGESFTV